MQTLLHGTTNEEFDAFSKNPESGDFNLCLTDDIEIADAYTQHHDDGEVNEVYEIDVCIESLASLDDLRDAAEACGIDTETAVEYMLADSRKVRDELRNRGFDAVEHMDDVPMWGEHSTIRVLVADCIKDCRTW